MKKYKIGYTCGVYDLFHVGHLNLLERCKNVCKTLIVGVCDDRYVRDVKHTEPIICEDDRLRIIKALKCVDHAELVDTATTEDKLLALERFHFNVVFAGDDWKGTERFIKTEKQLEPLGVKIEFFPYTKEISTSCIKNKLKNN